MMHEGVQLVLLPYPNLDKDPQQREPTENYQLTGHTKFIHLKAATTTSKKISIFIHYSMSLCHYL